MRSVQDVFVPLTFGAVDAIPAKKFFGSAGLSNLVHDLPRVEIFPEKAFIPPGKRTPKPNCGRKQIEQHFGLSFPLSGICADVFQFPTILVDFIFSHFQNPTLPDPPLYTPPVYYRGVTAWKPLARIKPGFKRTVSSVSRMEKILLEMVFVLRFGYIFKFSEFKYANAESERTAWNVEPLLDRTTFCWAVFVDLLRVEEKPA